MEDLFLHCGHLDGTGGVQCLYEGPYKYQKRGKPSLARVGCGRAEGLDLHGRYDNVPLLICEPAEMTHAHRGDKENPYPYDWLVKQQRKCSKYKNR